MSKAIYLIILIFLLFSCEGKPVKKISLNDFRDALCIGTEIQPEYIASKSINLGSSSDYKLSNNDMEIILDIIKSNTCPDLTEPEIGCGCWREVDYGYYYKPSWEHLKEGEGIYGAVKLDSNIFTISYVSW